MAEREKHCGTQNREVNQEARNIFGHMHQVCNSDWPKKIFAFCVSSTSVLEAGALAEVKTDVKTIVMTSLVSKNTLPPIQCIYLRTGHHCELLS